MIRRPCFLTWLLLFAASPAFAASSPAPAPAPATTQASPKAMIAQRQLYLQNADTIDDEAEITIRERVEQIGRERLGPAFAVTSWYTVGSTGGDNADFVISIDLTKLKNQADRPAVDVPPVAAEIADDAVRLVRDYVSQRADRHREELRKSAARNVDLAQGSAANAESKLKALRQNLRDMSGRTDVSPRTLTAAMSAMDQQLQQLQLERLSKESRRRAVEEELAKVSERVQKSVHSDAIATELQKVVDAREERVKTIQKMAGSGQASTSEVSDAIAQAAEARAKMLQQQRDAAAAAGGNILEKFNLELISLSIDSRELDAKIKYLEERLPGLRSSVEILDDFQQAAEEAERTANALRQANSELQKAIRQLEDRPAPRVMIRESYNKLD